MTPRMLNFTNCDSTYQLMTRCYLAKPLLEEVEAASEKDVDLPFLDYDWQSTRLRTGRFNVAQAKTEQWDGRTGAAGLPRAHTWLFAGVWRGLAELRGPGS
jgi:hypothetical protein